MPKKADRSTHQRGVPAGAVTYPVFSVFRSSYRPSTLLLISSSGSLTFLPHCIFNSKRMLVCTFFQILARMFQFHRSFLYGLFALIAPPIPLKRIRGAFFGYTSSSISISSMLLPLAAIAAINRSCFRCSSSSFSLFKAFLLSANCFCSAEISAEIAFTCSSAAFCCLCSGGFHALPNGLAYFAVPYQLRH